MLYRGYMFGAGAVYAKHARLGEWRAVSICLSRLWHWTAEALRNLWRHGRPSGLGLALALLQGVAVSLGYRLDRERRVYRDKRVL